jgi:hypothetical protein
MRTLIYIPIVPSIAEVGTLEKEAKRKSITSAVENNWQMHINTVNGYWSAIESYFENISCYIPGIKIYLDAMFFERTTSFKFLDQQINTGNRNSEIVSKLIDQGAILIKTEEFKMSQDEGDEFQNVLISKSIIQRLILLLRYNFSHRIFLKKRDQSIAKTIDETLHQKETGILFIGVYNKVMNRLAKDITVIELKEVSKIRKYQKVIQSHSKTKNNQLEQLSKYLVKK